MLEVSIPSCVLYVSPILSTLILPPYVVKQADVLWTYKFLPIENCALLIYYETGTGNFLPTFRGNLLAPTSRIKNRFMCVIQGRFNLLRLYNVDNRLVAEYGALEDVYWEW